MRFRIENKSKKGNLYPTRYTRRQEGRKRGSLLSLVHQLGLSKRKTSSVNKGAVTRAKAIR